MLRIGKANSDTCVLCDSGESDDVEHTVLRCWALRGAGNVRPRILEDKSLPEIVSYMLTSAGAWKETSKWLNAVMAMKTEKENLRRARFERSLETGRERELTREGFS